MKNLVCTQLPYPFSSPDLTSTTINIEIGEDQMETLSQFSGELEQIIVSAARDGIRAKITEFRRAEGFIERYRCDARAMDNDGLEAEFSNADLDSMREQFLGGQRDADSIKSALGYLTENADILFGTEQNE